MLAIAGAQPRRDSGIECGKYGVGPPPSNASSPPAASTDTGSTASPRSRGESARHTARRVRRPPQPRRPAEPDRPVAAPQFRRRAHLAAAAGGADGCRARGVRRSKSVGVQRNRSDLHVPRARRPASSSRASGSSRRTRCGTSICRRPRERPTPDVPDLPGHPLTSLQKEVHGREQT